MDSENDHSNEFYKGKNMDFDTIVIGSGFGGSVMSCRLVEKGYKVCLLERGKRYNMHEFPRRIYDIKHKLFWDPEDQKYGYFEFRDYPSSDLMSVSASGLGGGSLIYANVMMKMPEEFFVGWPHPLQRSYLEPFYEKALSMLEAEPYPFTTSPYYRETPKTTAFKNISQNLAAASDATVQPEFVFPHLAIRFKGDFPGHQTKNKHGALQSQCNKCGECDIGCNIHAKNTLDLNYLFKAQNDPQNRYPLEIRTEAEVLKIEPLQKGFRVTYCNPKSKNETTSLTCEKVVVAAGSIGSTALLLKMKKEGSLAKLNSWLGKKWCPNGDLEGTVLNTPHHLEPTNGPVITSAIRYRFQNYPDGFPHGCFIQDAGIPIGLAWYISGKIFQPKTVKAFVRLFFHYARNFFSKWIPWITPSKNINIGDEIADAIDRGEFIRNTLVLLGMGRDRSDGEIKLLENDQPEIVWKMEKSQLHYDRVRNEMHKIAEQLNGAFVDNPLTHLNKIIAVHPLGGCPMAESAKDGLVGTDGQSFDYPGLYVVDASIIPTSIGPNPSLTISAIAESIAAQWKALI